MNNYKISKERLSRAIIYNSIVFDFFKNINDYVDDVRNLKNNKLKIIAGSEFEVDVEEFKNASRINTSHALLVYSYNYETSLYNRAIKLYKENIEYKFGDTFKNLSSEEMIKQDLDSFLELGLIDEKNKKKVLKDLKFM
ncbi:hypothetical protein [Polaribacter sp.]|uniref:hypothetical protein n=1 Tax=Polaribacter sp. TaxID=1920175 RepID=UPI0025F7DE4A|nr:hypothetical protein [Polaribacter sp.]